MLSHSPKKSARISPDRLSVGVLSLALALLVMLASMAFSFEALRDAARWTGAPLWANFLAPIYIDGSILAYTVALAVFRWRREHKNARSALAWLRAYTAASMAVNALHAASFHQWNYTSLELWGGVVIAAGAPLSALVSAEQIIRLSFQREQEQEQTATAPAPVQDTEAAATESVPPYEASLEELLDVSPLQASEPDSESGADPKTFDSESAPPSAPAEPGPEEIAEPTIVEEVKETIELDSAMIEPEFAPELAPAATEAAELASELVPEPVEELTFEVGPIEHDPAPPSTAPAPRFALPPLPAPAPSAAQEAA
ncbi:DUF2637 domain-containing protein [Leucobacter sp. HY1910]